MTLSTTLLALPWCLSCEGATISNISHIPKQPLCKPFVLLSEVQPSALSHKDGRTQCTIQMEAEIPFVGPFVWHVGNILA